jgi:1-aminocyclopropane-1-carboxylate deaminase
MDDLQSSLLLPSPLLRLALPEWASRRVNVNIKRDDLIHPDIPGNKWRKLKYHLQAFQKSGKKSILSFGGPYSNHLTATAAACHYLNIPSYGIVRGEIDENNPAIRTARKFNMHLMAVSRSDFNQRESAEFQQHLMSRLGIDAYVIASGGEGEWGIKGCREIVEEINITFDYIITPCGTGTTLSGLATGLQKGQKAIGISALKGEDNLSSKVAIQAPLANVEIMTDYHFGGFGKTTHELLGFIRNAQKLTGMDFDYVYTGKTLWALNDLIFKGYFPPETTIIFLHTGGIQNARVEDRDI